MSKISKISNKTQSGINEQPAIVVKNLYKSFKLPHEKHNGIKQVLLNVFKRGGYETQEALKDVSFEVKKGEFFGIVGRNGSGKSTLLKLLAGIYAPDSGLVQVDGSLTPFIELGVGFNPELTGRENVFLNGALLGFGRHEMEEMYDEIVAFAELERFMDQKLKNYSSGMQVRLAFSIAIRADTDILVLDEVLAVGDEAFQRKCNNFFKNVQKDKTKTVILVTHDMDAVKKYCNRAILINNGKIKINGSPEDVANEYSLENLTKTSNLKQDTDKSSIKEIEVSLLSKRVVDEKTPVLIKVDYKSEDAGSKIVLNLDDSKRQVPLYVSHSKIFKVKGKISQTFKITLNDINDSNIQVALSIRDKKDQILAFPSEQDLPSFILRRQDYPDSETRSTYAVLFDRGEWQ